MRLGFTSPPAIVLRAKARDGSLTIPLRHDEQDFAVRMDDGEELFAVLQGIQALERPIERDLVIHTDSQYVIGVCAKGWKAKANKELISELRLSLKDASRIVWHWVRGHEGVALNERCDQLARDAISRRDSTVVEEGVECA